MSDKKVIIVGDSGIISRKERKDNQIAQNIIIGNQTYKDDKSMSNKEILDKVSLAINEKKYVGTSCPSVQEYISMFEKYSDNSIISLGMSSKISSGNSSAVEAAKEILEKDDIYFFDTLTGGIGGTLIDDYAVKLANEGMTANQILMKLKEYRKRLFTTYYVESPLAYIRSKKYSIKTEGLTGMDKMYANALKSVTNVAVGAANFAFNRVIKDAKIPVNVVDGELVPVYKLYKGDVIETSKKWLLDTFSNEKLKKYDTNKVIFGGIAPDEEVKETYRKFLSERFNEVDYVEITGTVATYGSENLMGINAVRKRK